MEKNNFNIYYGIIFLFLYSRIYSIFTNLFICAIYFLKINIYVIPIMLLAIVLTMLIIFTKIRKFPLLNLYVIIILVIVFILCNNFCEPINFYQGESKKQFLISNFKSISYTIFNFAIIIISFIKYHRFIKTSAHRSVQ